MQAGALPSESPVASDSFTTPWTVAHQAPLLMGFPRQEYWSGLPFPSPGDLPDPGVEPASPALAGRFFTAEPPRKPSVLYILAGAIIDVSQKASPTAMEVRKRSILCS